MARPTSSRAPSAKPCPTSSGSRSSSRTSPEPTGLLAAQTVANAEPDGYSLLLVTDAMVTTEPQLAESQQWDARGNLLPVVNLGSGPLYVAVNTSTKASTIAELVEEAKANGKTLSFGTSGTATPHRLAGETLAFSSPTSSPASWASFRERRSAFCRVWVPSRRLPWLLPITFGLVPTAALIMLSGIYSGAQYGGSTTAILVNMPGESSSVVTALDGYQMARQGRAGPALATAAIGSFATGTIAPLLIAFFSPFLADLALSFGSAEYFSRMLLGLVASIVPANGGILHAFGMVVLGLLLGTMGTDVDSGIARYTFGMPQLFEGINFIVLAVGLFGIGGIVANLEHATSGRTVTAIRWMGSCPRAKQPCSPRRSGRSEPRRSRTRRDAATRLRPRRAGRTADGPSCSRWSSEGGTPLGSPRDALQAGLAKSRNLIP